MNRRYIVATWRNKFSPTLTRGLAVGALAVAMGCGSASITAEESGATLPMLAATSTVTQSGQAAAANSRRGMLLFLQCRACHSLNAADGHLVGPNLSDLFGSVAGKKADFVYSESATSSNIVWDDTTLDSFLARPNDFFPGTKMAFAGIDSGDDRRALIAYLKSETQ